MYRVEEPSDNVSPMALVQNNSTNAVSSINDNFFTASNAQLVTMPQMQEMDIKGILANGRRTTSSSTTVDSSLSLFGSGLAIGASNKVNTECYESRMDENFVSAVVQMKKDDNATKVEINAENQKVTDKCLFTHLNPLILDLISGKFIYQPAQLNFRHIYLYLKINITLPTIRTKIAYGK